MAPDPNADTRAVSAQLEKLLDDLPGAAERVRDAFDHLVERAVHGTASRGVSAGTFLKHVVTQVRDQLKELLDVATKVIAQGFPIVSLFTESIAWDTDVHGPLSQITNMADQPQDDNLSQWNGNAAAVYRQKQTVQKNALLKACDNVKMIGQWLSDIGKANVAYVVELLNTLGDVAIALWRAVESGGTDFADVIDQLIRAGLRELTKIGTQIADMVDKLRILVLAIDDHTQYEDGNWPQAVYLEPPQKVSSQLRTT
jgi:hypothetical protein